MKVLDRKRKAVVDKNVKDSKKTKKAIPAPAAASTPKGARVIRARTQTAQFQSPVVLKLAKKTKKGKKDIPAKPVVKKVGKGKIAKGTTKKAKVTKGKKTPVKKDKKEKKAPKKGNDRLIKRSGISVPKENPFLFGPRPEFVSVSTFPRHLLRAVVKGDMKEMKEILADKRLHPDLSGKQYSYADHRNADVEVLLSGKLTMAEEYFKLKAKIDKTKTVVRECNLLRRKQTGSSSFYMLGRATRAIEMTRGGREGNNALLNYEADENIDEDGILSALFAAGTDLKQLMKLTKIKGSPIEDSHLDDQVVFAVRLGIRGIAATLSEGPAKSYMNDLHRATFKNGCQLPDRILPVSVVKKGYQNKNITPLHTAAINPDAKVLEKLRAIESNFNIPDQDNWYTIHYAAVCEGPEPLKFCLKNGAPPSGLTKKQENPLHVAAAAGRAENIKILLDAMLKLENPEGKADTAPKQEKSMVNVRTRYGSTALHIAVQHNKIEAVRALLSCSTILPDQPTSTGKNKTTPLMIACSLGHLEIARLLIEKGALVEAKDKKKRTALLHAVLNGQRHMAAMLLAEGASILQGDSSGNTAAHYAAAYGWLDCLQLLAEIDHECLSKENDWKITPLSVAYLKGHYGIVTWLLDGPYHGVVDINGKDNDGVCLLSSLLRYAESSTYALLPQQLDYLIEKGADCTLTDGRGNTILHDLASLVIKIRAKGDKVANDNLSRDEYLKCFEKLMSRSADAVLIKNQDQFTPLHMALMQKNLLLFEWMLDSIASPADLFKDWSTDGNILHQLLALPFTVWKDQARHGSLTKELYDILPLLNNVLLKKCRSEVVGWLSGKNKAGLEPALHIAQLYATLTLGSTVMHNEVSKFSAYVTSLFSWMIEVVPELLSLSSSPIDEETPNKKMPEVSIVNCAVSALIEMNDMRFPLLVSLIKQAANYGVVRELLTMTLEDEPLIVRALKSSPEAAKLILKAAVDHGCVDGIHDVVIVTETETSADGENEKKKTVNKTLLMKIIENKHFDLVGQLVLTPAAWKAKDFNGNSAWHYVAQTSDHRTVSLMKMLESKGVPRTSNNDGCYPLHVAVQSCDSSSNAVLEPIEWLAARSRAGEIDKYGRTALHYAFATMDEFIQKSIYKSGKTRDPIAVVSILAGALENSEIQLADQDGNTALHVAALRDANICTVTLLRKGATVTAVNKDGNTPLALAVLYGHSSAALTLIQANSSVTEKVVPQEWKEKENTDWMWEEVRPKKVVHQTSSIPAQIVAKGGKGWEAMVYVLLDALGKNPESLAQLVESAVSERQYNLANQLLKSLETILDGQPIPHARKILLEFTRTFQKGSLEPESVELTVLNRLVNGSTITSSDGSCLPLELALERRQWPLANFLKEFIGNAAFKALKSSSPTGGPMAALIKGSVNDFVDDGCRKWMKDLIALPHLDALNRCLKLPMPSFPIIEGELFTPLGWAAARDLRNIVTLLINLGADVNAADSLGRTPFMLAVQGNRIRAMKALLGLDAHDILPPAKAAKTQEKSSLVFGNFAVTLNGNAKRKGAPSESDSDHGSSSGSDDEDNMDQEDAEEEHQEEQLLVEPAFNMKKIKLADMKVNMGVTDKELRNIMHYLAASGWENIDLLEAIYKQQPAYIKQILTQKDNMGLDPIELAIEKGMRRTASAMKKLIGAKNYPVIEVALPAVDGLKCVHDISADSAAFMEAFGKKNDVVRMSEKPKPNKLSGYRDNGIIVECPETQQMMTVLLNRTDLQYGRFGFHNFYRMELIKRRDADLFVLFTNWGRIGSGHGEHQTTPFTSIEAGLKEFKSVWKSKTGQEWGQLSQFKEQRKKYRLVRVDNSPSNLADVILPSDGDKEEKDEVRAFVKDISNISKLKMYLDQVRGQLQMHTPFGRVTKSDISRARIIIERCQKAVADIDADMSSNVRTDDDILRLLELINELSSEFYSIIPTGSAEYGQLQRLDNADLVLRAVETLNILEEVEIATRLLTAAAQRPEIDRIEYITSGLECHIEIMSPMDIMSQYILQWVHNSKGSETRTVKGIFSLTSRRAVENFAKFAEEDNQKYLMHGTKATNLISILRDGLTTNPRNAQLTGRAFGDGVYLADMFEKSVNYCGASHRGMFYMLVCQTALGNMAVREMNYREQDNLSAFDSVHMEAQRVPSGSLTIDGVAMPLCDIRSKETNKNGYYYGSQNSEYIVRDHNRILPRYIVMFK